jgi:hypothetical protein
MNIWELIKNFVGSNDVDNMVVVDYLSDEGEPGVIAILRNKYKTLCFSYFSLDQWEMIQDTSSITDKHVEEIVKGIIDDLDTVVFIDPDDLERRA